MVTLRIFLIGLLALVPDRQNGALTVVLQKVLNPSHFHLPIIIYECKNELSGSDCRIEGDDEVVFREVLRPSPKFDAIVLDDVRIRVLGGKTGVLSFAEGRSRPLLASLMGDVPQNRREAQDFSWVPSMSNVASRYGFIADRHLENPSPAEIAGVLEFARSRGRVSTFGLVDIENQVNSFTFKKAATNLTALDDRQALADVVLVEIPLVASEAAVLFEDFHGEPMKPLILTSFEDDRFIDLIVGNLPPYLGSVDCSDPSASMDEHFRLYYNLSSAQPLPPPNELQIPFKGNREVEKINVEDTPPAILTFVESQPCFVPPGPDQPDPSSSNRPICTQVIFQSR